MSNEKGNDMTPEEINKEIAELLGWTELYIAHSQYLWGRHPNTGRMWQVDDYYHSLDACAEFERKMESRPIGFYLAELHYVCSRQSAPYMCANPRVVIIATAPQRCEAFLRMHNKWRE